MAYYHSIAVPGKPGQLVLFYYPQKYNKFFPVNHLEGIAVLHSGWDNRGGIYKTGLFVPLRPRHNVYFAGSGESVPHGLRECQQ